MIEKLNDYLSRHPEVRSAVRVFGYTFVSMFGLSLMGFLADVTSWATSQGVEFPSVSPLAKAFAAALTSGVSGFVAFFWNKLPKTKTAVYDVPPADGA